MRALHALEFLEHTQPLAPIFPRGQTSSRGACRGHPRKQEPPCGRPPASKAKDWTSSRCSVRVAPGAAASPAAGAVAGASCLLQRPWQSRAEDRSRLRCLRAGVANLPSIPQGPLGPGSPRSCLHLPAHLSPRMAGSGHWAHHPAPLRNASVLLQNPPLLSSAFLCPRLCSLHRCLPAHLCALFTTHCPAAPIQHTARPLEAVGC
jgi:hypothetical protein